MLDNDRYLISMTCSQSKLRGRPTVIRAPLSSVIVSVNIVHATNISRQGVQTISANMMGMADLEAGNQSMEIDEKAQLG